MTKEQIYDQIERYINGKLVGDELKSFLQKLESDPEFAKEVKLHQNLHSAITDTKKEALKETLSELRSQQSNKSNIRLIRTYRFIASAAAFILLMFAIWFMFLKNPVNTELMDDSRMVQEDEIQQPPRDQDTIIPKQQNPSELAQQEKPKKIRDHLINEDENEYIPEPIKPQLPDYSDRYVANAQLEQMITKNQNSEVFKFNVESPRSEKSIKIEGGSVSFAIAGMLQTSESVEDQKISIQIFDNKANLLSDSEAIYSSLLSLEKEDEDILGFGNEANYFFNNEIKSISQPGLYYYVFRLGNEGEIIFTQKLTID